MNCSVLRSMYKMNCSMFLNEQLMLITRQSYSCSSLSYKLDDTSLVSICELRSPIKNAQRMSHSFTRLVKGHSLLSYPVWNQYKVNLFLQTESNYAPPNKNIFNCFLKP